MSTEMSIFLTQIPIAVAILIGAIEIHFLRRDLVDILEKLSKRK